MKLIELCKNEARGELLAWRYPNRQLANWTQLLVAEGETAALLCDRRPASLFAAGRHTLRTGNYPLLSWLVRLPFGGQSPLEAEVWFLPTAPVMLKWGTDAPVRLRDTATGEWLSLRGYGQLAVRVESPHLFLTSCCRNLSQFGARELMTQLRTPLMQALHDCAYPEQELSQIAAAVAERLRPELASRGLELTGLWLAELAPQVTP